VSHDVEAGLDTSVFDAVIEKGGPDARRQLAEQLARLLLDAAAPEAEKKAVVPSLLKLAVDPVADIRRALAERLAPAAGLPADLVFTIVADSDDIALPFLAETASLDHWRMLAVVQVGDAARQMVVAQRGDLTKEVIAHIAGHCGETVCACLLDNAAARLSADDCRRLYVRFRDRPEVVERLLDRPDLPLEVRILQAKRAANRIHTLMAERGWIPANDAEAIVVDAEETTLLKILEAAETVELDRVIPFLCAKEMLTTSIILRAACRGRMAIVERALAYLASTSVAKVRQKLAGPGIKGLQSLISAGGLPATCLWLLKAAADVAAGLAERRQSLSPDGFARAVVEALMTRYDTLGAAERLRQLDLIARLTDERTKALALKLKATLARAA
jgi:uncharacterized protein (DUF2336 family)